MSRGLLPGAMVAPEIVVVERLELVIDRDDARPGRVDGDRLDRAPRHARLGERLARRLGERVHVVRVALGSVVGIVLGAVQRILRRPRPDPPARAIDEGDADREGAEIDACDDGHERFLYAPRPSTDAETRRRREKPMVLHFSASPRLCVQ